ncbi:MAG: hypothetical protein ACRDLE_01405 [Gaiellaceae bacterium]
MPALAALLAALACAAPPVHPAPYPAHAAGLGGLPWVRGKPASLGLVGLIWYWPKSWADVHTARIYTHGRSAGGHDPSMKILWVFLSPRAKHSYSGGDLVVQGRRLDGPGTTRQRFASVGYQGQNGAPSFASIIDLPTAGCWQLRLSADGLRATIDFLAVPD